MTTGILPIYEIVLSNISMDYGDDYEMILHETDEESIMEKLDNDHVLLDIMYLVVWNGILYYNISLVV